MNRAFLVSVVLAMAGCGGPELASNCRFVCNACSDPGTVPCAPVQCGPSAHDCKWDLDGCTYTVNCEVWP